MQTDLPLDPSTARLLAAELRPGETVLWQGSSDPRRSFRQGLLLFLFAVPWTGFSIFWVTMASRASVLFALFGVPFVLIGCAMFCAPWWAARRARRVGYALTTDRAVIIRPGFFGAVSVRSFSPSDLGDVERVQRANGGGDLIFSREYSGGTSDSGPQQRLIGFLGIADVRTVQTLIEELTKGYAKAR